MTFYEIKQKVKDMTYDEGFVYIDSLNQKDCDNFDLNEENKSLLKDYVGWNLE